MALRCVMRLIPWLLATLTTLAGPAFGGDDCTLDARSLVPQFSARLPKGFKLLSTRKDKRQVRQVLRLPDGLEVTVDLGGCEHLAYSFAVKGKGLTTRTPGAEAVAVAKRVLGSLPMNAAALAEPKVLLKAVDEGSFVALPATLPCGEATCRLELKASGDPRPAPKKPVKGRATAEAQAAALEGKGADVDQPAALVLSYDFAL
jgi:hypothetical protein